MYNILFFCFVLAFSAPNQFYHFVTPNHICQSESFLRVYVCILAKKENYQFCDFVTPNHICQSESFLRVHVGILGKKKTIKSVGSL